MRKKKCFIILTFIIGMATAVQSRNATKCTTPKSEEGVCIKIHDCPIILDLLSQTNNSSTVDFLKKSFCGFEKNIPKVCCENNPRPPTTCGISSVKNRIRIIGGQAAKLGAWPWMAALGYQSLNPKYSIIFWKCGGALVSRNHVLTAAHCVNNLMGLKLTTVRLGELDLNDSVRGGASKLDVPVQRIISHPKFDYLKMTTDIALLQLQNSVTFDEFIRPICLPITSNLKKKDLSKGMLFVAGWGITDATPTQIVPPNTVLMEVGIPFVNTNECKNIYSKKFNIPIDDKMICAGSEGKDSCVGDSGGPLMLLDNDQYFLMGIVSYGPTECGKRGLPGLYTRVPSFMDWIDQKINEKLVS